MDAGFVDDLTASTATHIRRAWLAGIVQIRAANRPETIALRLHAHDPVLGLDDIALALHSAQRAAYTSAGHAVARWTGAVRVSKDVSGDPQFDTGTPSVLSWAERNRLDKLREITVEQRILIRAALIAGEDSGQNPLVTAREIQESIGLTEAQTQWVRNFEASLRSGQLSDASARRLVDGRTAQTLARSSPLTDKQINSAVSRYRDRMIEFRAETIARTESSRIVNQAADESIDQAIGRGDLVADALECTWIHSPKAKNKSNEREFHVSMHGQKRAWGEPFISGLGNELMFPCDPDAPVEEVANCRCARTVRMRSRRKAA